MARIATLVVVLTALLAAAPAGADDSPWVFLESGTITPYTPRDHPFVTQTVLKQGHDYRLVLTGAWFVQWPAGSDSQGSWPDYEEQDDILGCVSQNPVPRPWLGGNCDGVYSSYWHWPGIAAQIGDDPNPTNIHSTLPTTYASPVGTNNYDLSFRSKYTGILKFWDPYAGEYGDAERPTGADGSFGFQVYGTKTDFPSGSTSGGGSSSGASGWTIGPVTFTQPKKGYFSGRRYTFYVQSTTDATVRERLSLIIGRKAFAAGRYNGVITAGKLFSQSVTVPRGAYNRLLRALQRGKTITMRATFTVLSSSGTVTQYIDVPFKGFSG